MKSSTAAIVLLVAVAAVVLAAAVAMFLSKERFNPDLGKPRPAAALWTLPNQRGLLQPIPAVGLGMSFERTTDVGGREFQSVEIPRGFRAKLFATTGYVHKVRGKANLAAPHNKISRIQVIDMRGPLTALGGLYYMGR